MNYVSMNRVISSLSRSVMAGPSTKYTEEMMRQRFYTTFSLLLLTICIGSGLPSTTNAASWPTKDAVGDTTNYYPVVDTTFTQGGVVVDTAYHPYVDLYVKPLVLKLTSVQAAALRTSLSRLYGMHADSLTVVRFYPLPIEQPKTEEKSVNGKREKVKAEGQGKAKTAKGR